MKVLRSRTITISDEDESISPDRDTCVEEVTAIFPDICPIHLDNIAANLKYVVADVVQKLLDSVEEGNPYPKKKKKKKKKMPPSRKRKRDEKYQDDDDDLGVIKTKYTNPSRSHNEALQIERMRRLIEADFPFISHEIVKAALQTSHNLFVTAYLDVEEQVSRRIDEGAARQQYLWILMNPQNSEDLNTRIKKARGFEREILEELRAARQICDSEQRKRRENGRSEAHKTPREAGGGESVECGCCYEEFRQLQLVHCDADQPHWFCIDCARKNAEYQIGSSRFELNCMSSENDCYAGFSHTERQKFLDENLVLALDRLEAEAAVRLAGIENLEHCPFCPYAAEVPPIEVDKEFRCINPDCEIISCRLCKLETHIPKTCEEYAEEKGVSGRQKIEEAMSSALIRKCNKCDSPFVKSSGCNKVRCGRPGCKNVQCYVCGQSCGYSHFNDVSRGGAVGNCPLFDDTYDRHNEEVQRAERTEKRKILEEDPNLDPDALEINLPDDIAEAPRMEHLEQPIRRMALPDHVLDAYQRLNVQLQAIPPHQRPYVDYEGVIPQAALPQAIGQPVLPPFLHPIADPIYAHDQPRIPERPALAQRNAAGGSPAQNSQTFREHRAEQAERRLLDMIQQNRRFNRIPGEIAPIWEAAIQRANAEEEQQVEAHQPREPARQAQQAEPQQKADQMNQPSPVPPAQNNQLPIPVGYQSPWPSNDPAARTVLFNRSEPAFLAPQHSQPAPQPGQVRFGAMGQAMDLARPPMVQQGGFFINSRLPPPAIPSGNRPPVFGGVPLSPLSLGVSMARSHAPPRKNSSRNSAGGSSKPA